MTKYLSAYLMQSLTSLGHTHASNLILKFLLLMVFKVIVLICISITKEFSLDFDPREHFPRYCLKF